MGDDESGSLPGEVEQVGHRVAWFHHGRPVVGGTVFSRADGEDGVRGEALTSDD